MTTSDMTTSDMTPSDMTPSDMTPSDMTSSGTTTDATTTNAILDFLATRRSLKPTMFASPGPSVEEREAILTVAARVPDHKKLNPWRFIVFEGAARTAAGALFEKACLAEDRQDPSEIRLSAERERFLRAPLVIAVVSRFIDKPGVPALEQTLSAGACAFNLCLAANALGYGTCWITEWIAYSPLVHQGLGLVENEQIAGFVYIGTATGRQDDRPRPVLAEIVTHWQG